MNKTTRYMFYAFDREDSAFKEAYNKFAIKSLYLGDDRFLKSTGTVYDNHLFVLINIEKSVDFYDSLNFLRCSAQYEDDYTVEQDKVHMLVLRINENYKKPFFNFKRGRYSKMFTINYITERFKKFNNYSLKINNKFVHLKNCKEIENLVSKEINISPYAVLTRSPKLERVLRCLYGLNDSSEMIELDSIPHPKEEIYNYDSSMRDQEGRLYDKKENINTSINRGEHSEHNQ